VENLEYLIDKRIKVYEDLLKEKQLLINIKEIGGLIKNAAKSGGLILVCGNGGSAAESLHLSGEIIGRFQTERNGFPVLALPADCAAFSAIANDYGYDEVFARQVIAFKDIAKLLILLSTSGNSKNLVKAAINAKVNGIKIVGLLGGNGGELKNHCDISITIPSSVTAEIQEAHLMIIHILCGIMEEV